MSISLSFIISALKIFREPGTVKHTSSLCIEEAEEGRLLSTVASFNYIKVVFQKKEYSPVIESLPHM